MNFISNTCVYTPVSSYQKIRKREFDRRRWMNVLENDGVFK